MAAVTASVAAGAAVAGTGIAAYGAYQQGQASAAAARYQAQVAANNKIIADRAATSARQAGDVQAQTVAMKTAQRQGAIRAAAGAAGLDPNQGSPLSLQSDTAKLGTLDALTVRNNAERTAYGYEISAGSAQGQIGLDLATAANASTAGTLAATGSLLSGTSSVSSKWAMYQQSGVFGGGSGGYGGGTLATGGVTV